MSWPSSIRPASCSTSCATRAVSVGLAFDDELVALRADANVEQRFEVAEVFVVGPEEGLEGGLGDGNLTQRRGWNSRISLCYSYLPESRW